MLSYFFKRRGIKYYCYNLLGLAISFILITGIILTVPFSEIYNTLCRVNLYLMALAMCFTSINLFLRGNRWALLFLPYHHISKKDATALEMIGLSLNCILPGRIGELVRITMGVRRFRCSFAFTTATLVAERLLDGLTLIMFLGASLFFLPAIQSSQAVQLMGSKVSDQTLILAMRGLALGCVVLIIVFLALAIPRMRFMLIKAFAKIPLIGNWLKQKIEPIIYDINLVLGTLHRPKNLVRLFLHSIFIWLALSLCNWTVSYGIEGISLNFLQALVITSISVAVSSIPSSPGAWGVFEAGVLFSLTILGIETNPSVAITFAFISHICQYLPVVVLGLLSMLREQVLVRSISRTN